MSFFDTYKTFYATTGTRLLKNRLHQRYKAIIASNLVLFHDARILDLASHDGRWTFAALKAGAKQAIGVEARAELVQRGERTFKEYGIRSDRYSFVCSNAIDYLSKGAGAFDVVLCLGFFYHTMYHMQLLELMARTGATTLIIDTGLSLSDD